nr:MAG TPA: protein of unknown function (DUF1833) [Caudoviricetes sp.]
MNRFELDKNSYSRYLGRALKMLIELKHSAFQESFCFINDTKTLELDSKIYQPYPFDIILPSQTETQGTQLVLSNIQNLAANEIRKTINSNENILLDLYIVNIETEAAEKYPAGLFEIFEAQITPESITATINIRHNLDVNMSTINYYRQTFPNLFL